MKQLFYLHLEMIYTYLALGDSYTIGEQVNLAESFPYQTVQRLRQTTVGDWQFTAPEIIAKTGWTTDELNAAIQQTTLLTQYDVVSLLIGVNNHYRARSAAAFKDEFTQLLQKAIAFAGGNSKNVFVLSIPDWGITPFAEGRDREKIANEIDAFNQVCKNVSATFLCTYIDNTASQREDGNKMDFLAGDGLHPSSKEYAKWADKLSAAIGAKLNR